jgi:hypothetical protein
MRLSRAQWSSSNRSDGAAGLQMPEEKEMDMMDALQKAHRADREQAEKNRQQALEFKESRPTVRNASTDDQLLVVRMPTGA